MRTLYLTLLVLISFVVNAQIEVKQTPKWTTVGKVKNGMTYVAELQYMIEDKDTTYMVLYNNFKYQHITDIQSIVFANDDNTVQKFYDILKTFFSEENKKNKDYTINLKLGDSDVRLYNTRVMGVTSVSIYTDKGYFGITEKQLDKLFGK